MAAHLIANIIVQDPAGCGAYRAAVPAAAARAFCDSPGDAAPPPMRRASTTGSLALVEGLAA